MAHIVRSVGTLKRKRLRTGEEVERSDYIRLKDGFHKTLDTTTHFVYKTNNLGSSILCTCGSPAIVVSYGQYKEWSSFIGNEVIACQLLIQHGRHGDGSS